MNHIKTIIIAVLAVLPSALLVSSCTIPHSYRTEILFRESPADSVPYRIPAIAQFPDGRIIALTDYRICRSDIGFGRVDLRYRISSTDGRRWGDEHILIEGTGIEGAVDCGFGDPAVVIDRESGDVLVIAVCGNTIYWHDSTTRQNPNRVALLRSKDACMTWEPWKEITEDVYSLFDGSLHGPIQSCFVTSGKIFQSRSIKAGSHYRIYAALCARPNGNRVLYSDDFGENWNVLGGRDALPVMNGDEAKCEELPDGSVVLSSRIRGGRLFNIYRYSDVATGEGSWGESAYSSYENVGCHSEDNACNGGILMIPAIRTEDRQQVTLALQSVPLGPRRQAVGIYYKEIDGKIAPESLAADWNSPYRVTEKASAYSEMILLQNGNVAFCYEENDTMETAGYDIVYKELPVIEITGSRYDVIRK